MGVVMNTFFRYLGIFSFLALLFLSFYSFAPRNIKAESKNIFTSAVIMMDKHGISPVEIRFEENSQISVSSFFEAYKVYFNPSHQNEFKPFQSFTDQLGQIHYRCKQYYKGIELGEVQFLLHEKNSSIYLAHGKLIHGLDLKVKPTLSEAEALKYALAYIGAESYMWENPKNEAFLKNQQSDPTATYFPAGKLMISAGHKEMIAKNFRLVYRFDVFAEKPLSRNRVDVDAHSGEIIGVFSRINSGDVQGEGLSLYNGMVPIVVSDSDYPIWPLPASRWHLDNWNAYGGSGESWWMADPTMGNDGGYDNNWYEVLDTDPIELNGDNPQLFFYHRYKVESPGGEPAGYDGWDGMNVRISTDNGATWQILTDPTPAYTSSSLYSFGALHGEGPGIPGWASQLNSWTQVTFDLSHFTGQTVQLRFAFASDGGLSTADIAPELFGWQIDEILISSSQGTLFSNTGDLSSMTATNNFKEATLIEGNYRLRESSRGDGVYTYDSMGDWMFSTSVDIVDQDSNFTDEEDQPGVSVHWAIEATYDYYLNKHGRKSYNDENSRLLSYVNQIFFRPDGNTYPNNAQWIGNASLYGVGDGYYYGPWGTLDIVGHEITHGVTQYSAGLIYANEPGALNESFSDIFGAAVEFFKESTNGDWLMGEDHAINAPVVRSLQNPKLRDDPDTYQGQYWVPYTPSPSDDNDYGGVHTNSGVQNHWFYLLSEGGNGVNDNGSQYAVTGIGVEAAEQIAYRNLTVYLMPTSQYADARWGSINAAIDLFGNGSSQVQAVLNAWFAVGIGEPYPGIYAQNVTISQSYLLPGIDTLFLTTEILNPDNHNIEVLAIFESFDKSLKDSIFLFDDGLHQDSSAGDGFFGGAWKAPAIEKSFNIHMRTTSIDSGYFNILNNAAQFTTAGPLVLDNFQLDHVFTLTNGYLAQFFASVRNDGAISSADCVEAELFTEDPHVTNLTNSKQYFGNIPAGGVVSSPAFFYVRTSANPLIDSIDFEIKIYSYGHEFWQDTDQFVVGLEEINLSAPKVFSLMQNFPNPFNPGTTIKFQIPKLTEVKLQIFNILGEEIETVISEKLPAGEYEYQWDASRYNRLASGIYLYRLSAGKFTKTKKMVLIK
jgi:Zn-dependent metalloprotease